MTIFGLANITVDDGGAGSVVIPASEVQVKIGTCSAGTANQPVATRSLSTLVSTFGYGPLVEAAALTIQKGGTAICVKAASNAAGVASTAGVIATGTGATVCTATMAAVTGCYDDYYIVFKCVQGGTVGTAGILFQVSLDAGRNYGPVLALGTATTYAIPNTGVTLNFTVATMKGLEQATATDRNVYKLMTIAPVWTAAGVQAAITALAASVYGTTGWGSMHVVGGSTGTIAGNVVHQPGATAADIATIHGTLETLAGTYALYTRCFFDVCDAKAGGASTAFGGVAETEAAWITRIQTDYASASAKRAIAGAAFYNMPSAFPNVTSTGAPRYRRPITWAATARRVAIPAQRMLSRVKDGALDNIVVDSTNDPTDGFIYHDERVNPGLDYLAAGTGSRFMSVWTRIKKSGVFISHPLTFAPLGSNFYLEPFGVVMDIACTIAQEVGTDQIDDDIRLNSTGTLNDNDAANIESEIKQAINDNMLSSGMLSPPGCTVVVSRTQNVATTKLVPILVTLYQKGYIMSETITIAYNNPGVSS